jgi:small subunit ribosomal protein S3
MGQKISARSNRLPLTKDWTSRWFSDRAYATLLLEDLRIRAFLDGKYGRQAACGRVEIRRNVGGQLHIILFSAKPGIIIGRSGSGLAELRKQLEKIVTSTAAETAQAKGARKPEAGRALKPTRGQEANRLKIDVVEIKAPELWARLVGDTIANQIERRIPHRRAIRQAIERVMGAGAKGVRIEVSGRLGGAEIARKEKVTNGSVPLSTFRKEIDFAIVEAHTTFGTIGIKVWIHRKPVETVEEEA